MRIKLSGIKRNRKKTSDFNSNLLFGTVCFQKSDGANIKNFKKTKQRSCIKDTLRQFVSDNDSVMDTYLRRLKSIQATQEVSEFFKSHEV